MYDNFILTLWAIGILRNIYLYYLLCMYNFSFHNIQWSLLTVYCGGGIKSNKGSWNEFMLFEKPSVEWLLPWIEIKDLDGFLLYGVTQFKPRMFFFNVLELRSAMFAFTEATIQLIICFHFSTFPYALREREVGSPTICFFFL